MDDDARRIYRVPSIVTVLVAQGVKVINRNVLTFFITITIDGDSGQGLWMWFYQHFTVLGEQEITIFLNPVATCVFTIFIICTASFLVIVAFLIVIIADTALYPDSHTTISRIIGAIDITYIATTEDVTIAQFHALVRAYLTTKDMHLSMSENVTVGIECTAFTEIIVASTSAKYVAMHMAFIEFYIGPTSLVDSLQYTHAVVLSAGIDDTASDSRNLTTSEEGVTHVTTIHLHVGDIHTTVVDIATTEDTAAVVQTVGAIARPCLIVQFLLVVVRAFLNIVKVARRNGIEVAIADKALVERDVRGSEYSTALTAAICVTLDSGNTVDEAGTVELTDGDLCLAEDITRRACADGSWVIAYTTLPSAAIDVTGRTALNIGMGSGNEGIVKVVGSYIVSVVHGTHRTGSIEILGHLTAKESDKGGSMNITRIGRIGVTKTATVGVSSTKTTSIHIAADISTLVDADVGVIFIGGQIVQQAVVGINIT